MARKSANVIGKQLTTELFPWFFWLIGDFLPHVRIYFNGE